MRHTRLGYWIEEADDVAPAAPLVGDVQADVVVIGGGYTGLWTAWYVRELEPDARVVVLEAEETCGRGPSGRNGGFCNAMWLSLASMRDRWGAEGALAVARAAEQGVERIGSFSERQGVDAWFRPAGYMQVSTAPAHDGAWQASVRACRELGADGKLEPLSQAEVAARCESPAFRAGVVAHGSTVQPARLALGLRERLLADGVQIFESSAARSLREGLDGVEARTAAGSVRAPRAVVAIGGAAKGRRGPLRGRVTVASSHIVLTEPVPDVLEQIGWTGGECITDSRSLLHYFRTTPDGRIAFGWGGGRIAPGARTRGRAELDAAVIAAAATHLHEYFPALRDRRIAHAWGGPIDASPTHLPAVRSLPGGRAFAAAGYTGNGVGPSNMVGRTLASLALDRRDDPTRLAFVDAETPRVPPEPLHWLGAESIRLGILRKEEAEMAGRRPGAISSALAKVPDLIGFHIGR
jgi:glycine/D-amino acid oxidase-like deaminating enzyme